MKAKYGILILLAMWGTVSCSDILDIPYSNPRNAGEKADGTFSRNGTKDFRRTLVVYSAGYNNLSDALEEDIDDICRGYVPEGNYVYSDNLLVFAHNTVSDRYGKYKIPTEPCLFRIYRNRDGVTVRDTVRTWPAGTSAVDTETLTDVLTYVHQEYPSGEYGMIFSSHATGWLPPGTDLSTGEYPDETEMQASRNRIKGNRSRPERSLGQDAGTKEEMDVREFADAIPMHLDYIVFDSCLAGGIELAYELRDVCSHIVFSQDEILADGMVYTNIVSRLLEEYPTNLKGVADDYYEHYNALSGFEQSASISVIDCSGLEELAAACRTVFTNKRGTIPGINPDDVQTMNYKPNCFFYDFRDIISKLGEDMTAVDAALGKCVEYKLHTENLFTIKVRTFSGLSMYLPSAVRNKNTRDRLNDYYSGYDWCTDTGYLDAYYL